MKTLSVLFAACILFSSFSIDDAKCVEIKGNVFDKSKKLDKLQVTLFEDGKEVQKLENAKCPLKFELPRNHYYSLEIKKEGFLPTIMIINTEVPRAKECNYHFQFDYDMRPESNTYNKEYVDYPVAIIKYIKSTDEFLINEKYSAYIKKMTTPAK
ncbi:MAG: hypothetical protein K0S33_3143 [Bacteroidetes bacterium]|jgi:hypothetical protein|nr:hypothetical protein [Bacteroidota bacterium]